VKKWALPAAVIAALVVLAVALRRGDRLPETPEAAVAAFFDAASRGDGAKYLRLTSGPLRVSLEDTRSQLGVRAFCESLRRTAAGMKGLATSRGGDAPPDRIVLDVELVFADRIERQRMCLAAQGTGWTIQSITRTNMVKPPVAYGTPVFEEDQAKEKGKKREARPPRSRAERGNN
jgi:hypothetical protein